MFSCSAARCVGRRRTAPSPRGGYAPAWNRHGWPFLSSNCIGDASYWTASNRVTVASFRLRFAVRLVFAVLVNAALALRFFVVREILAKGLRLLAKKI